MMLSYNQSHSWRAFPGSWGSALCILVVICGIVGLRTPPAKAESGCPGSLIDLVGGTNPGTTITIRGSTTNADDLIVEHEEVSCWPPENVGGPESLYYFVPPVDRALTINLSGSSFDAQLAVLTPCPQGTVFCAYNGATAETGYSALPCFNYLAGEAYTVLITGHFGESGDYQLNISPCTNLCGNGIVDAGEECDDGNQINGDGCSTQCNVEGDWVCDGNPSICRRLCTGTHLRHGFGGPHGYGEFLLPSDYNSSKLIDLSTVFSHDLNFRQNYFGSIYLNTNGTLSIGQSCQFLPLLPLPFDMMSVFAPFWADIDTDNSQDGLNANIVYYHLDETGFALFTWLEVEANHAHNGHANSFQVLIEDRTDLSSGDFDIEFRYQCIQWIEIIDADSANRNRFAEAGFYDKDWHYRLPSSGSLRLYGLQDESNVDAAGVWRWGVRDGNLIALPPCGDGVVNFDEECDDGNHLDGDGCSAECRLEVGWDCWEEERRTHCNADCGDGRVVGEEQCDDGNNDDGDGCSSDCTIERGWYCEHHEDSGDTSSHCYTVCGDGKVAGAEECDDANDADGDGCSSDCTIEWGWYCEHHEDSAVSISSCYTVCGDGKVAGAEECDDANDADGDGCSSACLVEHGWYCDNEHTFDPESHCYTRCGDGKLAGFEECDDDNDQDGDGCSAECTIEPGWYCDTSVEPTNCVLITPPDDGEEADMSEDLPDLWDDPFDVMEPEELPDLVEEPDLPVSDQNPADHHTDDPPHHDDPYQGSDSPGHLDDLPEEDPSRPSEDPSSGLREDLGSVQETGWMMQGGGGCACQMLSRNSHNTSWWFMPLCVLILWWRKRRQPGF